MDLIWILGVLNVCHFCNVGGSGAGVCHDTRCVGEICVNGICPNGCKDGFYQTGCRYECSQGCISRRCNDSGTGTGVCTDGCNPGYWGESCSSPCPQSCEICSRDTGNCGTCDNFHYGTMCDQDCTVSCPIAGCMTDGTCNCGNGHFGVKCELRCPEHCAKSNRKSGSCLFGCKVGHFGEKCEFGCNPKCQNKMCDNQGDCTEGCMPGYFGDVCQSTCSKTCRLHLCDRETGECTNGCTDGYYGEQCNVTCPLMCSVCNGRTGICVRSGVFEISTQNQYTEHMTFSSTSETNPSPAGYYIVVSFVVVLVSGSIALILFMRRRILSCLKNPNAGNEDQENGDIPRKLPDTPPVQYEYQYDEINDDEMIHSSQGDGFNNSSNHVPNHLETPEDFEIVRDFQMDCNIPSAISVCSQIEDPLLSNFGVHRGLSNSDSDEECTQMNSSCQAEVTMKPEAEAVSTLGHQNEPVLENDAYEKARDLRGVGKDGNYLFAFNGQRNIHSI